MIDLIYLRYLSNDQRTLISSSFGSSLSPMAVVSALRGPLTSPTNNAAGKPVTARATVSAFRGTSAGGGIAGDTTTDSSSVLLGMDKRATGVS